MLYTRHTVHEAAARIYLFHLTRNICILDIVVNGPREPGVGAELIGSDTCQKRENEFSASDSRKISSIRYIESGNNEKLRNIEVSRILARSHDNRTNRRSPC